MQFKSLQSGYWFSENRGHAEVQLIVFGSYIEFSIDGRVILTLADQSFKTGLVGVYLETAQVRLSNVHLQRLASPSQTDEHLVSG